MAQKPNNFLEVLANAGSAGLGFMADNYLQQKQQDKQNALSGFMTALQAQQAEMAQERHRQNTLMNQQQMVLADLKISEAMKAMSAKPEAPKTPTQVAQDFAEWFSALNVSGLPYGARVESPYGTYTVPSPPSPPTSVDTTPSPSEIRASANYQEGENRESIISSANQIFNTLPQDIRDDSEIKAITGIGDIKDLLYYLDTDDSWFGGGRRAKYANMITELRKMVSGFITGDVEDTNNKSSGISATDYLNR